MLAYCQLDSWKQISVKIESEFNHFHSTKCLWKYRLPKWWPFGPGGDELNMTWVYNCTMLLHWSVLSPWTPHTHTLPPSSPPPSPNCNKIHKVYLRKPLGHHMISTLKELPQRNPLFCCIKSVNYTNPFLMVKWPPNIRRYTMTSLSKHWHVQLGTI